MPDTEKPEDVIAEMRDASTMKHNEGAGDKMMGESLEDWADRLTAALERERAFDKHRIDSWIKEEAFWKVCERDQREALLRLAIEMEAHGAKGIRWYKPEWAASLRRIAGGGDEKRQEKVTKATPEVVAMEQCENCGEPTFAHNRCIRCGHTFGIGR